VVLLGNIVMSEMKSYFGANENKRGFRSYRDLYNKRIIELEHSANTLKEIQNAVKSKHEPNIRQKQLFNNAKTLLEMCMQNVHSSVKAPIETVDRLVL
jgi:intraflagellar transport protein 81